MTPLLFQGRRAVRIENELLRVTVLQEGGHIAEIYNKHSQISPLWIPSWKSLEPSTLSPHDSAIFGGGPGAKLLAGIMGHNVCLDIFGGPSAEEVQAGYTVHGEASLLPYEASASSSEIKMKLVMPLAQLSFERSIQLQRNSIRVRERIDNLLGQDRPIAWTQHVTLGPPFLDAETTQFSASVTKSKVFESDFGSDAYLMHGEAFDWPMAPSRNGGLADLRSMRKLSPASGFTAHLTDPHRDDAFFVAYSPKFQAAFAYLWKRVDFPWLGIWEENCSRQTPPWNGNTLTRGMEFGVSPFPESRREMVERGKLFDTSTFRWLPAGGSLEAEYMIFCQPALAMPYTVPWPEDGS